MQSQGVKGYTDLNFMLTRLAIDLYLIIIYNHSYLAISNYSYRSLSMTWKLKFYKVIKQSHKSKAASQLCILKMSTRYNTLVQLLLKLLKPYQFQTTCDVGASSLFYLCARCKMSWGPPLQRMIVQLRMPEINNKVRLGELFTRVVMPLMEIEFTSRVTHSSSPLADSISTISSVRLRDRESMHSSCK